MKRGLFVVIDGLGGSGKTTHVKALKNRFGNKVLFTHEPGGAPRAEKIRAILKRGEGPEPDALTDFFLFWAARAEHVSATIAPALRGGKMVVCDRFDSSTFAMQVCGDRQKNLEKLFWQCREHVLEDCTPDLYIILDTPEELARSRRKDRGEKEDRFDERESGYQRRVRDGYIEFARKIEQRAVVVDARGNPEEIEARIWKLIERIKGR